MTLPTGPLPGKAPANTELRQCRAATTRWQRGCDLLEQYLKAVLLLVLWVAVGQAALAGPVSVTASSSASPIDITTASQLPQRQLAFEVLVDPRAELDWADLLAPRQQLRFHRAKPGSFMLSEHSRRYWLGFDIHNPSPRAQSAFFYVSPINLDKVQLYCDQTQVEALAVSAMRHPTRLFQFSLSAGEQQHCLLQVDNRHNQELQLGFYDGSKLISQIGKQHFIDALLFTAVLLIAAFNFLAAAYYRDTLFAWLGLYSCLELLMLVNILGYIGLPQGLLPPWPEPATAFLFAGIYSITLLYLQLFPIYHPRQAGLWRPVIVGLIPFNFATAALYTLTEGQHGITFIVTAVIINPLIPLLCALQRVWLHYDRLIMAYLALRVAITLSVTQALLAYHYQSYPIELIFLGLAISLTISQYCHSGLLVLRNRKHAEQRHQDRIALTVASEVNRAKTEMLTRLSHDIRTPLSAILGIGEILSESRLSADQRSYISTLKQSSHELLGILEESTQANKTAGPELQPSQQLFNAHEVIAQRLDSFRNLVAERQQEVLIDIDPELPEQLIGDPGRLRQLGTHAVYSAFEHSSDGSDIEVSIKLASTQLLQMEFSHYGKAFSEAERHAASQRRLEDGSSILNNRFAIMGQQISLLGGQISFHHQRENRYTLRLLAPIQLPQLAGKPLTPQAHPALKDKNILFIEDNPALQQLLGKQCQQWGMNTFSATSPIEATALMRTQALLGQLFDVVLIDHSPSYNDLALAEQLWQLANTLRTEHPARPPQTNPIFILMAFADIPHSREELRRAHFSRVLSKPISGSILRSALLGELHYSHSQPSAFETLDLPDRQLSCLIAEDNPTNALVLGKMLEALGAVVSKAENGQQALDQFYRQRFDAVILDIEMPIMGGLEACRRMRAFEAESQRPSSCIFGLTANPLEDYGEEFLNAGMDMHLSKPIRRWELEEALRRWVKLDPEQKPAQGE